MGLSMFAKFASLRCADRGCARRFVVPITLALFGSLLAITPPATVSGQASGSPVDQRYPVVLGLGDSVTAGTACNCQDFITRYATAISASSGQRSVGVNLGVPGSTSADLEADLNNSDPVRNEVRGAGTVIITIGANDLETDLQQENAGACTQSCYAPDIAAVGRHMSHILQQIRMLRAGQSTTILVTNYWNVFVDGDVAKAAGGQQQLAWSDAVTRQVNSAMCNAVDHAGAICVDLYSVFKGATGSQDPTALLADDGDHPNVAGSKVITDALLAAAAANRVGN